MYQYQAVLVRGQGLDRTLALAAHQPDIWATLVGAIRPQQRLAILLTPAMGSTLVLARQDILGRATRRHMDTCRRMATRQRMAMHQGLDFPTRVLATHQGPHIQGRHLRKDIPGARLRSIPDMARTAHHRTDCRTTACLVGRLLILG